MKKKKSHKLVAAGSGLMIAAAVGFSQAIASDGSSPQPVSGPNSIELSALSTVSDNPASADQNLESSEATSAAQETPEESRKVSTEENNAEGNVAPSEKSEKNEAKPQPEEGKKSAKDSTEVTAPEKTAGAENNVKEPVAEPADPKVDKASGEKNSVSVSAQKTGAQVSESTIPSSKDVKAPKDDGKTNTEAPAVAKDTREQDTNTIIQAQGVEPTNVAPVHVVYRPAASMSLTKSSSSAKADAKPAEVKSEPQLGPVITLLAKDVENPSGSTVSGDSTANGQSMVVWFELPPAEGPALQPGQATQPLLGTAVSESAVNANVIPVQEASTQPLLAAQQAPSQSENVRNVQAAKQVEQGVLSRGLARTGSVAQYAAIMSAAALIVGVGMLLGAAATRRKQQDS